jgi:hypothetical protein
MTSREAIVEELDRYWLDTVVARIRDVLQRGR